MSWGLGSAIPTVDELDELNAAAAAAAVREVLGGGVGYYGPGALWHPPAYPPPEPRRLRKPRASRPTPAPRQVQVRPPAPIAWNAYGLPASAADANRWLEANRILAAQLRAIGCEETRPGVFHVAFGDGSFDGRGIA